MTPKTRDVGVAHNVFDENRTENCQSSDETDAGNDDSDPGDIYARCYFDGKVWCCVVVERKP